MILPMSFLNKICNYCKVCNVCNFDEDLLFSIHSKSVMSVIGYRPVVFDFYSLSVTVIILQQMVPWAVVSGQDRHVYLDRGLWMYRCFHTSLEISGF